MAVVLVGLVSCSKMPEHLAPTGYAITAPDRSLTFERYLADTRAQLQQALTRVYERASSNPFGDAYPLTRALEMRAPFEIREAPQCAPDAPRTGYLLIHGLTDSPYLLSAVSRTLAGRSPCSVVRTILLPGHGTTPGDSLRVHRDEWRQITQFGVDSFRERVSELYLVGYSAGATLAVEYADQHRDDSLLAGLILFSPALGLPDASARLAPYVRWFIDWLGVEEERDAAKYETLSINAGAEFYRLVTELNWPAMQPLDIPVTMAISGADTTVDVSAAEEFFCEKAPLSRRQLIWFPAADGSHRSASGCRGILEHPVVDSQLRTVSVSHVGVTLPPTDPHYGHDAGYRQCLHYRQVPERFEQCLADDTDTVYGERSLLVDGLFEGRLMRRATFNPAFYAMMQQIDCFLAERCDE